MPQCLHHHSRYRIACDNRKHVALLLVCETINWREGELSGADIGNEDLRAQLKTLQYELESFKQEREVTNLRHEKELRDVQLKAEEDFRKAQVVLT